MIELSSYVLKDGRRYALVPCGHEDRCSQCAIADNCSEIDTENLCGTHGGYFVAVVENSNM